MNSAGALAPSEYITTESEYDYFNVPILSSRHIRYTDGTISTSSVGWSGDYYADSGIMYAIKGANNYIVGAVSKDPNVNMYGLRGPQNAPFTYSFEVGSNSNVNYTVRNFNGHNIYVTYVATGEGTLSSAIDLESGYMNTCTGDMGTDPAIDRLAEIGYMAFYGTTTTTDIVPGIKEQPGATIPILPNTTDIADIKDQLKEQYPHLWDNAITNNVINPDGTISTITSVPVTMPDKDLNGDPITGQSNQQTPSIDPNTSPDSQQQSAFDNFTNPPTDPTTGSGQTPPPILPTGSASSLWAIYNPTQGQLNQFGAWLWSDNFIDQIKKLFNDPMQAIIGVHKIFVTPPTGGSATIVCGYLDSGVPSRTVSSQYTTVSCGSVSLREYFGNVFDYNPYTEVSIYLPFIGIQRLDVDDVMRATISVEYTVDVLTGACQAKVNVMRDSAGGTIYCFSGNCSVTYPISSGSYMGVVSAIASVAGTLVSAVATGGATAPLAVGAVSGLMHAKTNVQHSGSLSGNAGACGIKKPYLIISRPQTAMPAAYESIEGTSTNYTVKLGTCSGYTRVKEMHVDGVNCTASELADIERLLKEGVIL